MFIFQEVGEHSKIARSFERIRSIIRKHKKKDITECEPNSKLEELVKEMLKEKKSNPSPTTDLSTNKE